IPDKHYPLERVSQRRGSDLRWNSHLGSPPDINDRCHERTSDSAEWPTCERLTGPHPSLCFRRQHLELGHPPVEQEVRGLRQRDGDQLTVRVVEPRRAVAAGPAIAARNG